MERSPADTWVMLLALPIFSLFSITKAIQEFGKYIGKLVPKSYDKNEVLILVLRVSLQYDHGNFTMLILSQF